MSVMNQNPNLRVINDFLSYEDLNFWRDLVENPLAWDMDHPNPGLGKFMSSESVVEQEPWRSGYQSLLARTCSLLESIYEEPLVISRGQSFRKYCVGDAIGLHYDYSRDGDGKILQLHEETRRPGEMAPYPAGLHDIQSVVYYNDNYEGGKVQFGDRDWIQPKAGMLITWPSTHKYGHRISRIDKGERYISAMFWMRAKTIAIASYTDLLAENWRDFIMWPEKVDELLGLSIQQPNS